MPCTDCDDLGFVNNDNDAKMTAMDEHLENVQIHNLTHENLQRAAEEKVSEVGELSEISGIDQQEEQEQEEKPT